MAAASAAGIGNNIAVRLVGTAESYNGDILFEDFGLTPAGALCYDVDFVDAKSGDVIGTVVTRGLRGANCKLKPELTRLLFPRSLNSQLFA